MIIETSTARDCQLRAQGLREIVEALSIALTDWQELQKRAQAEGLNISGPAQDIAASLQRAARLIAQAG
jgi:post-segregation antitoxin (ccd killing protein)